MFYSLSNGLLMPKIGLGTFLISNEDAKEIVSDAIKIGYHHIDTAQMYGNEAGIGEAIKASLRPRSGLFITSKQRHHMSFEDAKKAFFQTLENLQTDYIDLFLIHWPNHDKKVNQETWRFFEWLYENKYAKAIGVSNFTRSHLEDLLETANIKPHVNQIELHPGLNQAPLRAFMDLHEIKAISYGPFMRGGVFEPPFKDVLSEIAKKHTSTIPQVAIAWGIQQGIFMIPKSSDAKRLKENYRAASLTLSDEDIQTINKLNRGKRVYTDPDNNPWGVFKALEESN
ncbi:MAG: aldo/keto reductase [Acholeplasmataceae bacterium]